MEENKELEKPHKRRVIKERIQESLKRNIKNCSRKSIKIRLRK